MIIDSIEVGNFRNYDNAKLEFHPNTNILYGDNAQGKTNILESIFVCGTTNSHKGSKDKELIQFGMEEAHIRMYMTKREISHKIDMHMRKNKGKGIAIDGVPIKRSSELMGLSHIIFFSPEDLRIIKNGPGERRRFMNMELCQLDPVYLYDLAEYNKILMQRNKLLKQISFEPSLQDTLSVWDEKLVEFGEKIIKRRQKFVDEIGELVQNVASSLTNNKELIQMYYEPDVNSGEMEQALNKCRERDLKFCSTNAGPHRDDLCFMNGEFDLRKYGSQGQQRTCALALKLAEIEIVKKTVGDCPVLLLDDVLSELDRNRQNYLLDSIHDIQTIITCTGLEEFIDSRLTLDRVFRVKNGTVTLEK
ncbi:MAG: DNA replication/repair protein RecF [Lachnospiraceae bacterium]|nr:DNA replication/repair protein RecF [Lachnospiraceae bacterium]